MKIWIFNLLVAAALTYLFLGESEQVRVKNDFEWAKDKVEVSRLNNRDSKVGKVLPSEPSPQTESELENHNVLITKSKTTSPNNIKVTELGAPMQERELDTTQSTNTRDTLMSSKNEGDVLQTLQNSETTTDTDTITAPQIYDAVETSSGKAEIVPDKMHQTGRGGPQENVSGDSLSLDNPEIARRRAIVLDVEEPQMTSDNKIHTNSVKANNRRDALNTLAEDMELIFVDIMAR